MGQFLRAQWRHLVMLNYPVDPDVLRPRVPPGTELDSFEGVFYVSMVGFMFLDTRILGIPIPRHVNFEEVNLRFYVRCGSRRGVVFVREIVPRVAIALVAQACYNEPYLALPMRHRLEPDEVRYEWRSSGVWNRVGGRPTGPPRAQVEGTLESFITEHYWGYCRQRDGSTLEYQVEHPAWQVRDLQQPDLQVDAERLYGKAFVPVLSGPPASAFVADGSAVEVKVGRRLLLTT
ncbi:MAG: YqjF family protein [Candidatus Xenobia bacterium]